MDKKFQRGDQVACIPDHANGDINHKDVEFGFVTSGPGCPGTDEEFYFVRYWHKGTKPSTPALRTKANSEATYIRHLVAHKFCDPKWVDSALEQYC